MRLNKFKFYFIAVFCYENLIMNPYFYSICFCFAIILHTNFNLIQRQALGNFFFLIYCRSTPYAAVAAVVFRILTGARPVQRQIFSFNYRLLLTFIVEFFCGLPRKKTKFWPTKRRRCSYNLFAIFSSPQGTYKISSRLKKKKNRRGN